MTRDTWASAGRMAQGVFKCIYGPSQGTEQEEEVVALTQVPRSRRQLLAPLSWRSLVRPLPWRAPGELPSPPVQVLPIPCPCLLAREGLVASAC